MTQDQPDQPPQIDTSVASLARIYDYWLGGKDNFAADREAGEPMIAAVSPDIVGRRPGEPRLPRPRGPLPGRRGRRSASSSTSAPACPPRTTPTRSRSTIAPDARIVYVDNDPIVLVHARALLTSTPEGATAYIDADLRDPDTILGDAAGRCRLQPARRADADRDPAATSPTRTTRRRS